MCKKPNVVSHSNADSEVISPDAVLFVGGLPALQLWDCALGTFASHYNAGSVSAASVILSVILSLPLTLALTITCRSVWLTICLPTFQTTHLHQS